MKDDLNESQVFVNMKEAKLKHTEGRKLIENAEKSIGKAPKHFVPNIDISKILDIKFFGILDDPKSFSSVSHHGDFNVKTQEDKQTCEINGSCQMLDGNIVMTDRTNEKLKLLDRSYKVIAECNLPGCPKNVCRTSPTEVAIVLDSIKKVQFAEVTEKIVLKGSFSVGDKCRGIAYNEGLLYLTSDAFFGGQVRIYDMAGGKKVTYKLDQHLTIIFQEGFLKPSAIVVSECRTLLHISDSQFGFVTKKLNGKWKCTNERMKGCGLICVVNNDEFIVSGGSLNKVSLFERKRNREAILLREKDGTTNPESVLYDRPNSRLIMSLRESNHIKVYNLV